MRLDYLVHCKDVLNYVIIMCGMESVEITIDITIILPSAVCESLGHDPGMQLCNVLLW